MTDVTRLLDQAGADFDVLEHAHTDRAADEPAVRDPEILSSRLRNYQYNPIWGSIAGQVWLR